MHSHHADIGSPIAADSQYTSSDEEDGDVMSLTPSITNYPMQWGRRYHKFREGKYLLPNDETESNRLDFQHAILKALHGDKFFFSPVKDPRKILDIGTGTGIWAVDLADSDVVPNARITGTDLSPIQPSDVPENVSFEIADCTEPDWYRPKDSVDLIFARMMLSSIASYPSFMSTAKLYLRPGTGWLECQDIDPRPRSDDGTIPANWPLTQWEDNMDKGLKKIHESLTMHAAPNLKRWMEDAGYVEVHEIIHKIPVGSWPKNGQLKRIGRAWAELLYDGLPAFSYKILGPEGLGMTRTEIEVFLADVRKSVNDRNVHYYFNFHTVCGRRPSASEEMKRMPPPAATKLQSAVSAN